MSEPARPRSSSNGSSTATRRPGRPRWPTSGPPTAQREPFGVRYWGVGNESWGCGGKFIPEDYCREYRRFTEWLPQYGVPLYLIAAGPERQRPRLDAADSSPSGPTAQRAPIHGWAPHYYCGTTGHALKFSDDQWYEQLHKANRMETLIRDQWAALGEFDRKHAVKLVIDEWGSWHPAGTEINPRHLFEQMGTLRDALVAALSLDTFNRHADKVDMANVAQLVNNLHSLFLADGDKFVATPTFHVYTMYRPHQGARAVRMDVQSARGLVPGRRQAREQIFRLAGSASLAGTKKSHAHAGAFPRDRAGRGRRPPARRQRRTGPTYRAHARRVERP